MNPIFLQIGPFSIYWYSILILSAILLGTYIVVKEAKKFDIKKEFMIDLIFYTIIISLIGARLYYCIFNIDYYSKNLIEIFKIWEGGLAIHGGIIFGLIFVIYYTKKHKQKTLKILDIMSLGLIIGQSIGRWGNFFNGEAHGPETTLNFLKNLKLPSFIINGMHINGSYYEPTFLYESLWCILGFILLILIKKLKKIKIGQIFSIYLIWYGIGRFIIESLRTDSLLFLNLKQAQIISILMIISGIIIFILNLKNKNYNEKYNCEKE